MLLDTAGKPTGCTVSFKYSRVKGVPPAATLTQPCAAGASPWLSAPGSS